jgi:hypothetical protein
VKGLFSIILHLNQQGPFSLHPTVLLNHAVRLFLNEVFPTNEVLSRQTKFCPDKRSFVGIVQTKHLYNFRAVAQPGRRKSVRGTSTRFSRSRQTKFCRDSAQKIFMNLFRAVAQPGSAPRSGRGGRWFESSLPD